MTDVIAPAHSADRIRVFDGATSRADAEALATVRSTVTGLDLAAPAVVLPDFHHKSNMELPSSVVVATAESVRPTLTSASVNCGMALVAFDHEPPGPAGIEEFYRRVKERYPYPPRHRLELTPSDVLRAATDGGSFAATRFGVDAGELERVEEFGRIDLERYGGATRLRRELPALAVQLARMRFGTVGPSNHFVELQVVEEILDPVRARPLGVAQGQLTLQYHGGAGVLAGEIGAMFGARRHNPAMLRAAMAVQKPLFHLASARSVDQVRERMRLYFRHGCPALSRFGDEGRRLLLANAAAMNYGFAFRLATYATLRRAAEEVFGDPGRLVVDSPHNSIYEEEVNGQGAIVHRHNACRAYPAELMPAGTVFARTGQAVLLPGTNRTSSYLCVAGGHSARSLHSACHGSGTVIEDYLKRGLSSPDARGRSTLKFGYDDHAPREVAQLDDRGVDEALAILVRHDLVRPVARMRPLAVLT